MGAAHGFVPRVVASADQIESERHLPTDLVDDLRDAGLFRLYLPRELGGLESSPLTVMAVVEELAVADASTAWCVGVGNQAAWLASGLQTADASEFIGPESILLGSAMPRGKATLVPGGFRVSGRWTFASGSPHATVFTGACDVAGGDSSAPPGSAVTAFLPASDCRVLDTWRTMGLRGTGSHDFEVIDAFVPVGRTFPLGGPSVYQRPLFRVPFIRFAGRGSLALGVARKAIDAFTELATSKKPFGSGVALAQQERVQVGLAEAEAAWSSARAWLHETTGTVWESLCDGGMPPYERRAQFALAVSHAAHTSLKVVEDVFKLGGTTSVRTTWVLERCLRDLYTATADVSVGLPTIAAAGRAYLKEGPPAPLL